MVSESNFYEESDGVVETGNYGSDVAKEERASIGRH